MNADALDFDDGCEVHEYPSGLGALEWRLALQEADYPLQRPVRSHAWATTEPMPL